MVAIRFGLILQLFVLINPLSSFPILMSAYKSKLNLKKIVLSSVLIAFVIAISVAMFGPLLFLIFNVSVDSFRIAGGIILFLLGIETIRAKDEVDKEIKKTDSIISIIATPLLTGPATISFISLKAFEIGRISLIFDLIISFLMVAIIFFIFLKFIPKINEKVINILSRILGLFLTALAIEMIIQGLKGIMIV